MPLLKRLRYALYVLIAVSMVTMLTLSIGEGIGFVYAFDIGRLMSNPIYLVLVFAIGLAIAPALAERLPVSGDPSTRPPGSKPPFGYAVRSSLLVAGGLVVVALLGVVLFLVRRFT
jgi:hypothetical protein